MKSGPTPMEITGTIKLLLLLGGLFFGWLTNPNRRKRK